MEKFYHGNIKHFKMLNLFKWVYSSSVIPIKIPTLYVCMN